jgi:hypothetical protein
MELHAGATNAWNRTNFLPSAINNNGVGSVLTPDSSTNTRAAAQWDRLCLLNYLRVFLCQKPDHDAYSSGFHIEFIRNISR